MTIRKVCVFGAGTMGGGIAAHLTNLGFQVSLLDATQASANNGLDRARTAQPPQLFLTERWSEIRVGNIEENIGWASEADWICEAIVERLENKQALFAQLDRIVSPDAMVTSNTSGLQIALLAQGLSDSFRRRFMGTHFFNPPRYLKLLELIPTPETDQDVLRSMSDFLESQVARRVVPAKDTPGFIANRYGMWSMFHATKIAENLRLAVEDVDAITGTFLGRPKSGTFRLNDIVGLDIMRDIATNLLERCPDDPRIQTLKLTNSMFSLLARGWIGDKAGHGYYRREGKEMLCLDLGTLAYRMHREADLPAIERLRELPLPERIKRGLQDRSEVGEYLRQYLVPALQYANEIKQEISYSVSDFDRVMKWGFGWEMGPFETIDSIGAVHLGISESKHFYQDGSQLAFSGNYEAIQQPAKFRPISSYPQIGGGETYVLRDLGDGITSISFTTKMGTINPKLVDELTELLTHKIDKFVLTSEARSFSAGFDLRFFHDKITTGDFGAIEGALGALQRLGERLEERTCVAAVFGHCLGAGLELALSCSTIVASAETKIGLPESRVGLVPGGRGVTLMRLNNGHSAKRLTEVTSTLVEGSVAGNAEVARQLGYLRPTDITVFNQDELIYRAKLALADSEPRERPLWTAGLGPVVGMIDQMLAGLHGREDMSEYDETIGAKLRQIVARSTSYEDALSRERSEFLDLCGRSFTQARIRHMVETGKPLRN